MGRGCEGGPCLQTEVLLEVSGVQRKDVINLLSVYFAEQQQADTGESQQ